MHVALKSTVQPLKWTSFVFTAAVAYKDGWTWIPSSRWDSPWQPMTLWHFQARLHQQQPMSSLNLILFDDNFLVKWSLRSSLPRLLLIFQWFS